MAAAESSVASVGPIRRLVEAAEALAPKLSFLRRTSEPLSGIPIKIVAVDDAAAANAVHLLALRSTGLPLAQAPANFAPFQGVVTTVITTEPVTLARVSSSALGNELGRYFVALDDIKGLQPIELRNRLGLTYLPDTVSEFRIPQGRLLQIGEIASVPPALEHGTRQFVLQGEFPAAEWLVKRQ